MCSDVEHRFMWLIAIHYIIFGEESQIFAHFKLSLFPYDEIVEFFIYFAFSYFAECKIWKYFSWSAIYFFILLAVSVALWTSWK